MREHGAKGGFSGEIGEGFFERHNAERSEGFRRILPLASAQMRQLLENSNGGIYRNFSNWLPHRDIAMSIPLSLLPDSKAAKASLSMASMGAMRSVSRLSFNLISAQYR